MIVNVALPGIPTVTFNTSAAATFLAIVAALVVAAGIFWAFGGNAFKRGAIIGGSSLSFLTAAAFLDTYNSYLDFDALVERAMFSTYGLPFMSLAGGVAVALMAVGSFELMFDDEAVAARAEKRRLAEAAMHADNPTNRPVTFITAASAFSGGRTDVLTNGYGWRRPAHAA